MSANANDHLLGVDTDLDHDAHVNVNVHDAPVLDHDRLCDTDHENGSDWNALGGNRGHAHLPLLDRAYPSPVHPSHHQRLGLTVKVLVELH